VLGLRPILLNVLDSRVIAQCPRFAALEACLINNCVPVQTITKLEHLSCHGEINVGARRMTSFSGPRCCSSLRSLNILHIACIGRYLYGISGAEVSSESSIFSKSWDTEHF